MIHFVVGTRAQLLKLAPVMRECEERGLDWRWVYTAQHRDTIDALLATFELPAPDVVVVSWRTEAKSRMRMARWLASMSMALPRSRRILANHVGGSHVLLTHGDTFTTWLGALMGRLTRTNVMHVEAGLRSFNLLKPFPEELNRLITFRLANFYACPGQWAVDNLRKYHGTKLNTGSNTQVDTLRFGLARAERASVRMPSNAFAVATIHRYENIFNDERFAKVIEVLERIAQRLDVVFICHPATRLRLDKLGLVDRLEANARIELFPRLEYLQFLKLILAAEFVVSDGGGNQEELSYLGKPTLILRDETERQEGLGENAVLAGVDQVAIERFVSDYAAFRRPQSLPTVSPASMIVDFLEERGFGRP